MQGKQENGQLTMQKQNTLVKKGECIPKAKFDQIVDIDRLGEHNSFDMDEIIRLAANETIKGSSTDRKKRLLLLVNYQNDFFRNDLFDIASVKNDAKNILSFIYNNLGKISRIIPSLDAHIAQQIYHQCWWVDKDGKHPEPYTIITAKDISKRIWIPLIGSFRDNLQYVKEMEKEEGRPLCIYPYYTISGTEGSSLEGEISKMVYFHSAVRNSINNVIWNGLDFYTQAFGYINPEYRTQNVLNAQLLLSVEKYNEIFIAGESILDTLKMIARYYEYYKYVTMKITILTDCTSSIKGFEQKTREEFEALSKMYGIKLKRSTDIKF